MPILNRQLRVMHIISGDLWAGAEAQAFTLLKQLNANSSLHVIIMNDGELYRRLITENIHVTLIPESQLNGIKIIAGLIQTIRIFKPDILHTHRQKENIFGSIANLLSSIPFRKRAISVRTSHGAPEFTPRGKQNIQVWLDNWTGKYLQNAIIAVSTELAEKLKKTFPPTKVHVIHNGVDSESLLMEAKIADFRMQMPNHLHIGIIGRVESVKRIDIFIDMAELLLKNSTTSRPLKFHVIGDGSLRNNMTEKVKALKLNDDIYFHGHVTNTSTFIRSLHLIVMCSDHEGTPMTALEALALGTPLIAHDTGGLTEILKSNSNFLVSNHSASGYAKQVERFMSINQTHLMLDEKHTAKKTDFDTSELYKNLLKN